MKVEEINRYCHLAIAESQSRYGRSIESFKDLRVYQHGVALTKECYELSEGFPKSEQFGLATQLRRAAVSIPANLAEGWGRSGKAEFARFVDISMGSLCEVLALLHVCVELNYTGAEQIAEIEMKAESLGRMLHKLRTNLRA